MPPIDSPVSNAGKAFPPEVQLSPARLESGLSRMSTQETQRVDDDSWICVGDPQPPVPMNTPMRGPPMKTAANAALGHAQMAVGMQNPNSIYNSTMGSWNSSISELFGACFAPLWFGLGRSTMGRKDPPIGSDSDDDFEISLESIDVNFKENYIGGGNQSSVFMGKHNGKFIALKKLNRASEVDIRKLMSLEHPNVIRTLGICTKDIYPVIIMDFCEKGGLYDVLRRVNVTKALFMKWTEEIASGMNYLHSVKIVHRDLKTPNILVDTNDGLKICDFGSLYTWDKTQMQSVVMSVCGTSQWMCPEMLKNEPCNDKVDVWSFGVCFWEILTQVVPYKGIAPMAIMYGVGSGKLSLHVPKTAPEPAKLLMRLCWAKRPRNRPSFASILNHLANLRVEIGELSEDSWTMRKSIWAKDIYEANEQLMMQESTLKRNNNATQQQLDELVKKRMNELRHAQEIRQMYEAKWDRVNKMMKQMFHFLEKIRVREEELRERESIIGEKERELRERELIIMERERELRESRRTSRSHRHCSKNKPKTVAISDHSNSGRAISVGPVTNNLQQHGNNPAGSGRSVKVQKTMEVRLKNQGDRDRQLLDNAIYSCVPGGQRAVVTMSVDLDSNDEEAESNAITTSVVCSNQQVTSNCPILYHQRSEERDGYASSCSSSANSCDDLYHLDAKCPPNSLANTLRMTACASESSSFARMCSTIADGQHHHRRHFTGSSSSSNLPHPERASQVSSDYPDAFPAMCPCCQYSFFNRNSTARVSGISADSGFCHLEERDSIHPDEGHFSKLNSLRRQKLVANSSSRSVDYEAPPIPDPNHHNHCQGCNCQGSVPFSPIYRNVRARWSDGKIKQRSRRPQSHTFARDSPLRTPSMKRERRSYTGGLVGGTDTFDDIFQEDGSHYDPEYLQCSKPSSRPRKSSSFLGANKYGNDKVFVTQLEGFPHISGTAPSHGISMGELEYGVDVEDEEDPRYPSTSSASRSRVGSQSFREKVQKQTCRHPLSPLASNVAPNINNNRNQIPQAQIHKRDAANNKVGARSQPQSPNNNKQKPEDVDIEAGETVKELIDLNQNPAVAAAVTAAIMETSHSTMVSSLERSLEMAIAKSDGLSDKECKLKAARSSFRTHRRTASNPTNLPNRRSKFCETSTTESDNEQMDNDNPVYC
ncbi:protein tyrosine kinase domain-containing protein [Ditylenchus destructor]|nr:protein tyrosine kinase domain-containing protein [Ditylenchus destructor]